MARRSADVGNLGTVHVVVRLHDNYYNTFKISPEVLGPYLTRSEANAVRQHLISEMGIDADKVFVRTILQYTGMIAQAV